MAKERVLVQIYLGIQGHNTPVLRQRQWIDFQELAVIIQEEGNRRIDDPRSFEELTP